MNRQIKMKLSIRMLLAAVVAALAPNALAGPDTFGLGDGHSGPLTVGSLNTVVNSYAQLTSPAAPGDVSLTVSSTAGFAAGDLVMVLQTTGIVPTPPSGGPGPIDLSNDPVGRWELARLNSAGGTTLTLTGALLHSYAANVAQVIKVPEYTTVTVNAGASIVAQPWNGSTGGVVAFLAQGALTVNGNILASGRGFRGGNYVDDPSGSTGCSGLDEPATTGEQKGEGIADTRYGPSQTGRGNVASGAGGGVCLQSGGGGGGNGGAGGQGGNSSGAVDGSRTVGGIGGTALTYSTLDHLTLGGGGGAGHGVGGTGGAGGQGGGIVFIRAGQLLGSSATGIAASGSLGAAAGTDAASGGGAGGTIYLRIAGTAACTVPVAARGGPGGTTSGDQVGPGGGGGGGRVLYQACSLSCAPQVAGAGAGVEFNGTPYGATAGGPGVTTSLTNCFAVPAVPTVATPANGTFTNNQRPPISGTASASTTVVIYLDGAEIGRTTSDAAGNWTFTPAADIPVGAHQVAAAAESQGVQSLPSPANTFTVDITPPTAPVVSTPANGSAMNNNRPPVSGTAEANSTVTVYFDGSSVGTTTADGTGSWSFTPSTPLTDASHNVKATATDLAGNVSVFSNTNTFTVDTTPPPAPGVNTPANGSITGVNQPVMSGTAEANSTVTVYIDNTSAGTTTANGSGAWTFTPSSVLPDGSHNVKVTATDAVSNTSVFSNTNTFTVDTTPPPAPVVQAPANGSFTNNTHPVVSGTAEPNSTLTLFVDGNIVSSTIAVDGTGKWSFTLVTGLTDGSHAVKATATDAVGNTSVFSNTNTFTVDTSIPGTPTVTSPTTGQVTNNNKPPVTGTAEANSTVTVFFDNVSAGTTSANGSGAWTFTPSAMLSEGGHTVRATATDAAGNTSPSSTPISFTVDTVPPGAPVVLLPADGSSTNNNRPTFSGTAEADSTVTVYLNGTPYSTPVQADSLGNWSLAVLSSLADGTYQLSATATDAAGNVSASSNTNTFTVDTTAPAAPVITSPADNATIGTATPTFSGTAEAGATISVYLDSAGTPAGTTTASNIGAWSFTVPAASALSQGLHTVQVEAKDAAGNISPSSNTVHFVVDLTPPSPPVFTFPTDGAFINTITPTITGTSEPGSAVEIVVDSGTAAQQTLTVTSDNTGHWSVAVNTALAEGVHTAKARATDTVGNVGAYSNPITFTVDTIPPGAPVVQTPANGSFVKTHQPLVTGTAEAGAKVFIYFDGSRVSGSATADNSGNWTYNPSTFGVSLPDGSHQVYAVAQDAAGNQSVNSNTNMFTVDTVAPAAPTVVTPADGSTVTTSRPSFSGTAEAGSTVTVYVDGNVLGTATVDNAGNWTLAYPGAAADLTDGTHTVSATATDAAGNTSPTSNVNTFIVSGQPPDTTITSGPNALTNATTATFTFTSTKSPSTFECSLDGGAFTACTTPFTLTGVVEGSHTLAVRAKDQGGIVDPSPATWSWTVDLTPPGAPTITEPSQGAVLGTGTPTITGTGEPGTTVTISIDGTVVGTATVDTSGHWTFTPGTAIGDGQHTVTATASDAAGNSATSGSRNFVVDTTAPDTTLTAMPDASTRNPDATFEFTSNEQGATFECSLDGAAYAACTSPATFTGLAAGSHTFSVRAKDAAGNVDASPASFGWTVLLGGHFVGGGVGSGVGCSATGGESALALLSILGLLARAARRKAR